MRFKNEPGYVHLLSICQEYADTDSDPKGEIGFYCDELEELA